MGLVADRDFIGVIQNRLLGRIKTIDDDDFVTFTEVDINDIDRFYEDGSLVCDTFTSEDRSISVSPDTLELDGGVLLDPYGNSAIFDDIYLLEIKNKSTVVTDVLGVYGDFTKNWLPDEIGTAIMRVKAGETFRRTAFTVPMTVAASQDTLFVYAVSGTAVPYRITILGKAP